MDMACMHDSLTDLVGWMEFMGDAFVWHGGGGGGGFTHSVGTN